MGPRSTRAFALGLGAITLGALLVRIGAAFWYDAHTAVSGDATWYLGVARQIEQGIGFVEPLNREAFGKRIPTAGHPPLYPVFLSAVDFVGAHSTLAHRLWSGVPGAATVLLLGLLGRDLAGERAGLLAAALGAVFVDLVAQDVILWSEGLFATTIVLSVWLAYRFVRRPGLLAAALLAGAITLAALTRAEAALGYLVLLVPLAARARELAPLRRVACVGVGAVVAVVMIAPWFVHNAGRFEEPVLLSTGFGRLFGSSNCPSTYAGPRLGAWGGNCAQGLPDPTPLDETVNERLWRDAGVRFVRAHAGRLPIVIPVRLLRSFGFWDPVQSTRDDLLLREAGIGWLAYAATAQYWLYLALAIGGGVVLARRKVPLLPLAAPVVLVIAISVIGYGTMRFRVAFEAILPAAAAVALDVALRHRGHGTAPAGEGSNAVLAGTVSADS